MQVKDPKGLAISYWNRYLKQFRIFVRQHDLELDFDQEIELIALEAKQCGDVKTAGEVIGKGFRSFLYKYGLRKVRGYWKVRELTAGHDWWEKTARTNITPDGFNITSEPVWCQRRYKKGEARTRP